MWGNSMGWRLSAAIVLVAALAMYYFGKSALPDPTPGFLRELTPIELPVSPDMLVSMDESCDSGDAYRDAINEYNRHPNDYDSSAPATRAKLPAVEDLVKATHCKNITLFSKDPSELINYAADHPALNALTALGTAAIRQGLILHADHKPQEAEKYYDAAFALGAKLFKERVTYRELETGEGLMGAAIQEMDKLATEAKDEQRTKLCDTFAQGYATFDRNHIKTIWQFVDSIDFNVSRTHAGDVFYLANKNSNSVDHMWQVEAIRTLGRYRWEDVGGGPQRQANTDLKRLSESNNPEIQTAAKLGLSLTRDSYQEIGG